VTYRVEFTGSATKELANAHPEVRAAIARRIDALAREPRPRGAVPLRGDLKGLWRLRVGDYRVMYAIDDVARVVTIAAVGPRGSVYS